MKAGRQKLMEEMDHKVGFKEWAIHESRGGEEG